MSPYKVDGKNVMHKTSSKWTVKQHCTSHDNAVKAVKLLHMKGYGSKGK
jgi:hypothetical protein